MTISDIKALMITHPAVAREAIKNTFTDSNCSWLHVCTHFGVSRTTMWRIIKGDADLRAFVSNLREELRAKGISQRGYGDWHSEGWDG